MRITISFISIMIVVLGCSNSKVCDLKTEYVFSSNDSIPVLELDISKSFETIRSEMNDLYGEDLCQKCSWVDFRLPIKFYEQDGYLKVMVDFDSPICEKCPIPMRLRYYYPMMVISENHIIVDGEKIELDSLPTRIEKYLEGVGENPSYPETFKQVNYSIYWNKDSKIESLKAALSTLSFSHLSFIESELERDGIDFCSLQKSDIEKLKENYPLRIELDLGKNIKNLPNIDSLGVLRTIEIMDETESEI